LNKKLNLLEKSAVVEELIAAFLKENQLREKGGERPDLEGDRKGL